MTVAMIWLPVAAVSIEVASKRKHVHVKVLRHGAHDASESRQLAWVGKLEVLGPRDAATHAVVLSDVVGQTLDQSCTFRGREERREVDGGTCERLRECGGE